MIDRVALRFLLTGCVNTALGVVLILIARLYINEYVANLIGYLVVVPISFLTHRSWSFRDEGQRLAAFSRFTLSICLGYTANLVLLTMALDAKLAGWMAQIVANATHVSVVYLLSRYWVFQHQSRRFPLP